MSDGRYRVVRGADGVRYLYLFPPGNVRERSIVLDEGDVVVQCIVKDGIQFEPWSVGALETLLNDLEQCADDQCSDTPKAEP